MPLKEKAFYIELLVLREHKRVITFGLKFDFQLRYGEQLLVSGLHRVDGQHGSIVDDPKEQSILCFLGIPEKHLHLRLNAILDWGRFVLERQVHAIQRSGSCRFQYLVPAGFSVHNRGRRLGAILHLNQY